MSYQIISLSVFFQIATAILFAQNQPLFSLLPSSQTGVDFANNVPVYEQMNVLISQYHYNGGGVALGDINNDGLADIFFVQNFGPDKLYLNKGNFKFEDITESAGVAGTMSWETGVSMVDINQDGWLDIYVSRSGLAPRTSNDNLLYINNGDMTFSSKAFEFGLLDFSHSTQAAFFDYDKDGDLDMYLLNHNIERVRDYTFTETTGFRDDEVGDILFRNDNGKFVDVSEEAGIIGKEISYGLGIMIGDLNKDSWPDIYVCNDFAERDYLYFNNGDGTFTEKLKSTIDHIPYFSMGGDFGDINNDGWLDIMTLDMTAQDNFGKKANMNDMNPGKFHFLTDVGMHYQYMVNCLQLNRGPVPPHDSEKRDITFSDIGMLAGVGYTDWSWAPLFADFDHDGWQDLFISNGYRVDISNKDYVKWYDKRQQELDKMPASRRNYAEEFQQALARLSSSKTSNFIFRNQGDLTFEDKTQGWGMDAPSFSNGVAYGDLDNDGDWDMVINNLDQEAFIYKNNAVESGSNHYLKIILSGSQKNLQGIGTKLTLETAGGTQYQEFYPVRGFQSANEPVVIFGLGNNRTANRLQVTWPDGKQQVLTDIPGNQTIEIRYETAREQIAENLPKTPLFSNITQKTGVDFVHQENEYDDFQKEILLPHKMSQMGPGIAVGDVNGDGREDFFVGGAHGSKGQLFLQQTDMTFNRQTDSPWHKDINSEDTGAHFFDADGDHDLDLYVVSGGNEFEPGDPLLQDRLYINDGKGYFRKSTEALPKVLSSGQHISSADFDQDGDLDLFVGGRVKPGNYPSTPNSYLLENQGGIFKDVTSSKAPELSQVGMVTEASWTDFNQDGTTDLILLGEWMPVTFFANKAGKLVRVNPEISHPELTDLSETVGWWFSLETGDFDKDGDMDFLAGNLGLNYKYKASKAHPFEVYSHDFDQNGTLDIVLGYYEGETLYPVRGLQCSSEQMPVIREKFKTYNEFASASLQDIFKDMGLQKANHHLARTFATTYFKNLGNGSFELIPLPNEAQIAPVNDILSGDFNADGITDFLLAGNLYQAEVETPRADAGKGLVMLGNKKGKFSPRRISESGFLAAGDVKYLRKIKLGKSGKGVLVVRNDGPLSIWKIEN